MKNLFRIWLGLFIVSTLLLSSTIYVFFSNDLRAFWLTREGVASIKSEDFSQAFEKMSEALQLGSNNSLLHLNLGVTQELLKREEEAVKSYSFAEKSAQDPEVQFYSWFNLGRLEAQRKNYKIALDYYQRALEIDPNSEPVKINIELLIQQQQQEQQQKQDSESQSQGGQNGEDQQQPKDPKDSDEEKENQEQPKSYAQPQKQKKKFESQDLQESDVKKILGELERQEQKIRREYNKQKTKERSNDKDW